MMSWSLVLRLAVLTVFTACAGSLRAQSTIFDSTLPTAAIDSSVGFAASSVDQVGGYAVFGGTDRALTSVVVQMSSQTMLANGAPYPLNLTLSLYNVGAGGAAGTFLASVTQPFLIPAAGASTSTSTFFDASFTFSGLVVFPGAVIWTIGFDPGLPGPNPQNSLNLVINAGAPTSGAAGNRDLYRSGLNDNPDPSLATITRENVANYIGAARFNAIIPEPSVAILAGTGLLVLGLRARRRD